MSKGHTIEALATELLIDHLRSQGRHVEKRRTKTFDLVVDGVDAEVKGKGKPFKNIDFISLTQTQYRTACRGHPFLVFVVCGVLTPGEVSFHEVSAFELIRLSPVVEKCYFFYRRQIEEAISGRAPYPTQPTSTVRRNLPLIVRSVIAARGEQWSAATAKVALSDFSRIGEAMLAEMTVEEVVNCLNRHGVSGHAYRYLLSPLIEEARQRRLART